MAATTAHEDLLEQRDADADRGNARGPDEDADQRSPSPGDRAVDPQSASRTDRAGKRSWFRHLVPPTRSLSASWRQQALRRYQQLRFDLLRAQPTPGSVDEDEHATVSALLEEAGRVAADQRVIPSTWWSGAEIERTWRMLREVEERRVDLLPAAELDALAAGAAHHAAQYGLGRDDPRVVELADVRKRLAEIRAVGGVESQPELVTYRSAIRAVLVAGHARADHDNQEARAYRNRLLLASLFSLLAAAAIVALQVRMPRVPFIDVPGGWPSPPWSLLVAVMVFGSAGALLTAIPVLAKLPTDFRPFNLPLQQALLKVCFGALTAVFGVAAVGAVEVSGITVDLEAGTATTLLVLAVAFGSAQQTVTRFFDKRAKALMEPPTVETESGTGQ
jgi:hypothetical protein